LEKYLQDFQGVLIIVSHDRAFADKVADHLFVFEGDGVVKDFQGTLSEYASTLIEIENESVMTTAASDKGQSQTADYKEDRNVRLKQQNASRQAKKEMEKLEKSIEILRSKAQDLQKQLDESKDEGWSVLADLTAKLDEVSGQMDEQELQWLEAASVVEQARL
jgi:ATP-binding cassette subfamily F protein uup